MAGNTSMEKEGIVTETEHGKKKAAAGIGLACMILGVLMVTASLGLFIYNQWDACRAQEASAKVLTALTAKEPESPAEEAPQKREREMTEVNIDGYDYIGYVSVPSQNLELPVMSKWSYEGLKIAPGRYSGSVFTGNLVIAGHNYPRHFRPIRQLAEGEEVDFTDMDGEVWIYEVSNVETLQPTQIEEMITAAQESVWDLTLFTCSAGGSTRCAVRCILKDAAWLTEGMVCDG